MSTLTDTVPVPRQQYEALMTVARAVNDWSTCRHGSQCEHLEPATQVLDVALGEEAAREAE